MVRLAARDNRRLDVLPLLHGAYRLCRSGTAMIFRLIRFFFGPVWWVAVVLALLWSPFLVARLIDAPM